MCAMTYRREEWNVPDDFSQMVANGDASYSILGVETRNNMESMERFIDAVNVPVDKIEIDDGTQVILTHPDPTKVIVVDASGLGDFFDSGFDVAVVDRSEVF